MISIGDPATSPADDGEAGENDDVGDDVERVIGGSGDDRIGGRSADNILVGNEGSDSRWRATPESWPTLGIECAESTAA